MAKRRPDDDDGFEVVDDEPPPRKKRRPVDDEDDTRPTRSAKTRFNDDDEPPRKKKRPIVADEDEPPRKKKRPVVQDDEDDYDRPKSRSRRDDDNDDRPRKKKSRLSKKDRERMRQEDIDARDAANDNAIMEWGAPIFLTFLGTVMILVSGVILARRTEGLINPALMIGVTVAYTLVLVPVVIAALMVIGGVCGIDYGTIKNAIRSLVAITFLVNGIYAVGNLFLFGFFLTPLIAGIVTFALFMVFFSLDPQETSTSLGILNVILWVANKFIFLMIIVMLSRGSNRNRDNDPGFNDDDDNPRAADKGGAFGNRGNRPKRFNPDDFDDDN